MHTSSVKLLARLEAVGSGVENDVIFHFHPPMFSLHPIWHSYAAWFERLDPNTLAPPSDVSFIVFRHLALRQSKRSEKTECEVVSGTYCKHFHDSCRCYFMCLTLFLKTLLDSTHCSLRWCNLDNGKLISRGNPPWFACWKVLSCFPRAQKSRNHFQQLQVQCGCGPWPDEVYKGQLANFGRECKIYSIDHPFFRRRSSRFSCNRFPRIELIEQKDWLKQRVKVKKSQSQREQPVTKYFRLQQFFTFSVLVTLLPNQVSHAENTCVVLVFTVAWLTDLQNGYFHTGFQSRQSIVQQNSRYMEFTPVIAINCTIIPQIQKQL